jgi:hypothetical protein
MNGTRHPVRSSAPQRERDRLVVVAALVAQHAEHVQRIRLVRPQREHVAVGALGLVQAPRLLGVERAAHQRVDRRGRRDRGRRRREPVAMLVALAAAARAKRVARRVGGNAHAASASA